MARKHRSAADASASERARLAREARKRRDAKPKSKYSGVTEQIKRIASKEKSLKLMWRKVDSSADGSVSMRELHRYLVCMWLPYGARDRALRVRCPVCLGLGTISARLTTGWWAFDVMPVCRATNFPS